MIPRPATRDIGQYFLRNAPLEELWELLAIDEIIPQDWVQNGRRRFSQTVQEPAKIVAINPLRTEPEGVPGSAPTPLDDGGTGPAWGESYFVGQKCLVRRRLSGLHPPTFGALRTFASLDPRAVLQAEALSLSDAQRNSHPAPEYVSWIFANVADFEDGDPDETEQELYKLGFAQPPKRLPWGSATIICPVLVPVTMEQR